MKKINGYNNYFINEKGEVFSKTIGDKLVMMKPYDHTSGYLKVSLCQDGTRKEHFVHRLVATAYCKNPKNKPCVDHVNGIKTDNRVENLEFVTHQENTTRYWAKKRQLTA